MFSAYYKQKYKLQIQKQTSVKLQTKKIKNKIEKKTLIILLKC